MSETQRYKYPRTTHLPWSKGVTHDDLRSIELPFDPMEDIVITEKLDGENTTMYWDTLHARSIDGRSHRSRNWVKSLQAQIGHLMPNDFRLCGENMYAQHSIAYEQLESYFYLFSIWQHHTCLSWDETLEWASLLELTVVPQLYRGALKDVDLILFHQQLDLEKQEGFVIRPTRGFTRDEFTQSVFKWVRPHHVQTDEHWMFKSITPNKLKEQGS
jgi:hypothetical protein